MRLLDVYSQLRKLSLPALRTQDVAAYFNLSLTHASKLLARLAEAKHIIKVGRGKWVFPDIDRLALPEVITSPLPAYISLQTALYHHGMISQIPNIIYAVSLARTATYKTELATISIHHIQPNFFFGYEYVNNSQVKMATPEKALLDIFYLSTVKSNLFRSLPEVELPRNFSLHKAREMIKKIISKRQRYIVEDRLKEIIKNAI